MSVPVKKTLLRIGEAPKSSIAVAMGLVQRSRGVKDTFATRWIILGCALPTMMDRTRVGLEHGHGPIARLGPAIDPPHVL